METAYSRGRRPAPAVWRETDKALYRLAGGLYVARPIVEKNQMDQFKSKVAPADGKLAVLLPGVGGVATPFLRGVEAGKAGVAQPIGSLTQMAQIRLGKRSEK